MGDLTSVLPILYLFTGLALGIILTWILTRTGWEIDYTVVLFISGVLTAISAALLKEHVVDYEETLFSSILAWENINPELVIFAFLPALIFGESQNLNLHTVKKVFWSASLLAIPGAAFTAYLIAVLCKYILNTGWDWRLCWLVGSVLCATDPVAVVAILKSTAASQKCLQYLIVLEALLNDGIALVLFGLIDSKPYNDPGSDIPASFTTFFIKVLLVSPLLGLAVGLLTVACLKYFDRRLLSDDPTMQIGATICCAYLSFFVAQYSCEVSGVLSCFTAGLVVSYLGRPLLLSSEGLEQIWRTLEFSMNTLIFLAAGLIVGSRSKDLFSGPVVLAIVVVYVGLFVIRARLVAVCHAPMLVLMPDFSPSYTWRDAAFTTFSGLRGAMSLTLALLLGLHSDMASSYSSIKLIAFPDTDVEEAVFVICWVVALSIIVNGSLASRVFRWLGLVAPDAHDKHRNSVLVSYVSTRLHKAAARQYKQLTRQYPAHDPSFVLQRCSVLRGAEGDSQVGGKQDQSIEVDEDADATATSLQLNSFSPLPNRQTSHHLQQHEHDHDEVDASDIAMPFSAFGGLEGVSALVDEKLLDAYRAAFLQVVNLSYLRQISEGKLPRGSRAAIALLNSVDVGFDTTHTPGLQDFDHLTRSFRRTSLLELSLSWTRRLLGALLAHVERLRETNEILALLSFIEAHEYAQAKIPLYLGPTETITTAEEAQVVNESAQLVDQARELLRDAFSEQSIVLVTSRLVATTLLHATEALVLHFHEEGILGAEESVFLLQQQRTDLLKLARDGTF
jgi:NhaP-type Na+/H+ or K+/H+ antiporter